MKDKPTMPVEARFIGLKDLVFEFSNFTLGIAKTHPDLIKEIPNPFLFLIEPWLLDFDAQMWDSFENRRAELRSKGVDGDSIKENLALILESDKHIADCCGMPLALASILGSAFINYQLDREKQEFVDKFDEDFSVFSGWLYDRPVKKFILSHLFNFDSDSEAIQFETFRVLKVNRAFIAEILGEYSFANYLHLLGSGEYFVEIESDVDNSNYLEWFGAEVQKANLFSFFLQYFKDGVVSTDYSVVYYDPAWVTHLRRKYFFPVYGDAHRFVIEGGRKPYYFIEQEAGLLRSWIRIYSHPSVLKRAESPDIALRKTIEQAGDYYEASHLQKDESSRLVWLSMALEALFSPSSAELKFRISQYASQFVGANAKDRLEKYNFVKSIYDLRSKIVHGSPKVTVTVSQNEALASIVRKSILGFFLVYLRGENNKDGILSRLEQGALNSGIANKLRRDSNIDSFIEDFGHPTN